MARTAAMNKKTTKTTKTTKTVDKPNRDIEKGVVTPRDRKKLTAAKRRGSPERPPPAPRASSAARRAKGLFAKHPTLEF